MSNSPEYNAEYYKKKRQAILEKKKRRYRDDEKYRASILDATHSRYGRIKKALKLLEKWEEKHGAKSGRG